METNPYAHYFARLDELVPRLEAGDLDREGEKELADLIRRAAFFAANTLNTAAVASPHLILPVEGEVTAPEPPENEGV